MYLNFLGLTKRTLLNGSDNCQSTQPMPFAAVWNSPSTGQIPDHSRFPASESAFRAPPRISVIE
jgi:hypothetical protein